MGREERNESTIIGVEGKLRERGGEKGKEGKPSKRKCTVDVKNKLYKIILDYLPPLNFT